MSVKYQPEYVVFLFFQVRNSFAFKCQRIYQNHMFLFFFQLFSHFVQQISLICFNSHSIDIIANFNFMFFHALSFSNSQHTHQNKQTNEKKNKIHTQNTHKDKKYQIKLSTRNKGSGMQFNKQCFFRPFFSIWQNQLSFFFVLSLIL